MTRLTLAAFIAVGILCSTAHGLDFQYAKRFVSGVIDKASDLVGKQKQIDPPLVIPTFEPPKLRGSLLLCQEDGHFAHPSDCSSYISCEEGVYTIVQCPEELHFNNDSRQCEESCRARCDDTIACDCGWDSCGTTVEADFFTPTDFVEESTEESSKKIYRSRSQFECYKEGLFADPADCSRYIYCADGRPYYLVCAAGLHFSQETERCERPCDARCDSTLDCKWKSSKTSEMTTDEDYTTESFTESSKRRYTLKMRFVCPEDGMFMVDGDCTQFIHCYNGMPYVKSCPSGLHFSNETRRCDIPCVAKCDPTASCKWRSFKQSFSKLIPDDITCDENERLPNPGDCKTFIQCYAGVPYVKSCPELLHFNRTTLTCEDPCLALCDLGIQDCGWIESLTTEKVLLKQPVFDFTCEEDGLFENPLTCENFIQCVDGSAYLNDCPFGQHYSSATKRCTSPCEAQCVPNYAEFCKDTEKSTMQKVRLMDFSCETDGYHVNPLDCQSFVQCFDGSAYAIYCPYGLHYSSERNLCTRPCDAKCAPNYEEYCRADERRRRRPYFPFINEKSVLKDFPTTDFVCPEEDGRYPYVTSETTSYSLDKCNYYIECVNGQSTVMVCPLSYHFRNSTKTCEPPCEARCELGTYLAVFCDWENPYYEYRWPKFDWVCFRNELFKYDDCLHYIECLNRKAYIWPCPEGLHFHDASKTCVHPCQAKCDSSFADVCGFEPFDSQPSSKDLVFGQDMQSPTEFSNLDYPFPCLMDGTFSFPGDCSNYIHCSNGFAYTMPCPDGLHFNNTTKRCETPCEARCNTDIDCDRLDNSSKFKFAEEIDCEAEPEPGTCNARLPRYYYDVETGRCRTFYYGGCGGNSNNFETVDECTLKCQKKLLVAEEIDCEAEPEPGTCEAQLPRYYYDVETGRCRTFYYGGCGGNSNNFETMDECTEKCQKKLLGGFRCPSNTGNFGHYPDCLSYYHCKRGNPILKRCPKGTAFDHKKSKCVTEYEAVCVYECRDRDAAYPFERDCHKYIDCVNGVSKLEKCPPGEAFHPDERDCVPEERVSACSLY